MSDQRLPVKPLACPHGSSLPCSQCFLPSGSPDVKKVVYVEGRGVFVDGKLERATLIPQKDLDALKEDQRLRSLRGQEGRRDAVCSACGEHGHKRNTCHKRSKLLQEPPIEKSESELKPRKRGATHCSNCSEVGHNSATCPIKNAA